MEKMTDEKFIEYVVANRMELCYSRWKEEKNTNSKKGFDKIAEEYEAVLSSLSKKEKEAIENYFATMFEECCEETNFFYRAGIKDGYNLYHRIKEIQEDETELEHK